MDYKDTLNLPKTDFPMKADLAKNEPETLKRWEKAGLFVKSRFMMGFATDYVPGWDCHGLPIELQVEKDSKQKAVGSKQTKLEIRKNCRAYAEKYINIQREEFKRLGVFGEWNN